MRMIGVDEIVPAHYNPRRISEDKIKQLEESIKENGFCLPVLVNASNNVIIAGHQRTKAAKRLGITEVPCFMIDGISETDEILFNQFHNGTDEERNAKVELKSEVNPANLINHIENFKAETNGPTFGEASTDCFEIMDSNALIVRELCKLILRYGNVFCAVINDRDIIIGKNYIHACKLLNIDINISLIKTTSRGNNLLKDKYGEFYYDELKKNTWVQGLAQLQRSDTPFKTSGKTRKSRLYENMVLPYVRKNLDISVLDFGCGKGQYISKLKTRIHTGLEFYNNNGKSINVQKGNAMISGVIRDIVKHGLYDVVVCDSVMNSVDSMEAEQCVVGCLNVFCKLGGRMFICGRAKDEAISMNNRKKTGRLGGAKLTFIDNNGMTAQIRNGQWFYQKFDTKEHMEKLLEDNGFEIIKYGREAGMYQIECVKVNELPNDAKKRAIDFEFNLPLPNNASYNRQDEVKKALGLI